ncbi:hypothetical protein AAHA92_09729 [Salvia divinorum]|uniref:Uncharacterized protein n=1 Tax=Salvia divinorum TaxID=28513 RepID=A0ABD1HSA9_SALDI
MDMLAKQLSQIATSLSEMRGNDGKIPATVKMPGKENISRITLRSGKDYEGHTMKANNEESEVGEEEPEVASEEKKEKEKETFQEGSSSGMQQTKPFPYRGGAKKKKEDPEFITGKVQSDGKIVIGENVSAVIQKRKLPSKRTDPGMFMLPFIIGDIKIEHAMCDLGASINVEVDQSKNGGYKGGHPAGGSILHQSRGCLGECHSQGA